MEKLSVANIRELGAEYKSWSTSIKALGENTIAGAEQTDVDHLVAIRYDLIDGSSQIETLLRRVDQKLTDLGYTFPEREQSGISSTSSE